MKPGELVAAGLLAAWLALRWRRFSREGRVVIALAVAGLIAHGLGAFKLPNVEHLIVQLGTSLGQWTYLLVGAMAFAETGAFLGFVAPGEVTVIVGGVVAGQGQINVVALIAIVWSAAVAGDIVSYSLGRRLGRGFLERHGRRVKITPQRLDQVEDFFRRRGGLTILVGRFIGFVRPIAPFLAGSTGMAFRRFIPYDVLAAGLWSSAFVLLGYVFWQSFSQVADIARKGALAFGLTVALLAAIVVAVRRRQEISQRLMATPAGRAVAGPLRFAWQRLTPGQLGLELTTLLAIAGVGVFAYVGYLVVLSGVPTTPGDMRALDLADRLRTATGDDVARALTWLGAAPVVWPIVFAAAGWLAARRRAIEGAVLAGGMALTILAVHVTKAAVDRPRPLEALVRTDGDSYPSGHSAYAVALVAVAVALGRAAPTLGRLGVVLIAVVAAALVGLTRIYLRAHYLSDVLGGAGLAAAIFALGGVVALVVEFVRNNARSPT